MIEIRSKLLVGIFLSALTACGVSPGSDDVQPTQEDLRALPVPLSAPTASAGSSGSDDVEQKTEDLQQARADISLTHSNAELLQTSDTAWTLAKTGTVDATASTVTWNITATQGSVTSSDLVVDGDLGVHNAGNGAATIGNIVVNLQTRVNGHWVTQSSDIADATHDDAATSAHVVQNASTENQTTFSENATSGQLKFMNSKLDAIFSLVPEVTIPAHATVPLNFTATFKNSVLNLAVGTKAHVEVIVTFGNNAAGGPKLTDTNVDINGNGVIDPDEAKVRSVSTEIDKTVQPVEVANSSVTLSDAAADIATTGTVSYSNPVFTLGATTGTVTVTYVAGAMGGSITNCAHATGSGVTDTVGQAVLTLVEVAQLQACNTQSIGAPVCVPGVPGCGWKDGDMTTYGVLQWVSDPNAISLVENDFASVYASTGGALEVGIPGDTGFSMAFSSASTLFNYLPPSGTAGPLDTDFLDPTSTSSGFYGGDVVALALDVNYGDLSLLPNTVGVNFGDLTLCELSLTGLNGSTVRQFLALNETLLGGGTATYGIGDVQPILESVGVAFISGDVTSFAQDHLVNGACP